jgi:hypothetical protein
MQFQEAFYHETALVHRPSGTNEIIDIIDKSSKNMDPKPIFRFIPHYLAFRFETGVPGKYHRPAASH